jgi:hypothetical protein
VEENCLTRIDFWQGQLCFMNQNVRLKERDQKIRTEGGSSIKGRAVAQAVSSWLPTEVALVRA